MRAALLVITLTVTAGLVAAQPPRVITHQDWRINESDNFRLFHTYDKDYAERVLRLAEDYRTEIGKRWFGEPPAYRTKCDIYLTTAAGAQPGLTSLKFDNGAAILYRIDLRVDIPIVYNCILPHEIMHSLLGAHFGRAVPRWADEGLAAQTETDEAAKKYLATVRQSQDRFQLSAVMAMADYPRGRVELFYAQSAVLVKHLVRRRGERAFIAFLDDLHKDGADAALRKHYQLTYEAMEADWLLAPAPKDEAQADR